MIIFIIVLVRNIYLSYENDTDKENVMRLLTLNKKVYKDLNELRYKGKKYKAIAIAINHEGRYAYWYTSAMISQEAANKVALKKCNQVSEKVKINKSCKLYNELLTNQNF